MDGMMALGLLALALHLLLQGISRVELRECGVHRGDPRETE
jgi:hypothetical protein